MKHTLENGHFKGTQVESVVNYTIKQPENTYLKNCTAVITEGTYLVYPWMTIGCDVNYEATYVCQDIDPQSPEIHHIVNTVIHQICDDDWFLINGSDKCFFVAWQEIPLSFFEAENMCTAQNASLLTTSIMPRQMEHDQTAKLGQLLIQGMKETYGTMPGYVNVLHLKRLPHILFGSKLKTGEPKSNLPSMISALVLSKVANWLSMTFFVDINRSCSVIESSVLSAIHSSEEALETQRWAVKCRACNEPLNVTGVICEKQSKLYNSECENIYFQCNDGTCILLIYKCDLIDDCFDGSDEEQCLSDMRDLRNHFLVLPTVSSGMYQISEMNPIPIHTICDGVYSNETFIKEEDVCFKYKLRMVDAGMANKIAKSSITKFHITSSSISSLFETERRLCSPFNTNDIKMKRNTKNSETTPMLGNALKTKEMGYCSKMNNLCIVKHNWNRCDSEASDLACKHFSCPGMFKCNKGFCTHMSAVCDGQPHCDERDDEIFCPLSSCPGMLKCRGEKRCVGKEEICDNQIDCLYSMDDELHCFSCPLNCECNGYMIICHLNNSENIFSGTINYIKGLILKGVQEKLGVHSIYSDGLIYLNVSFCSMKSIFISKQKHVNYSILIADFQSNKLTLIKFLNHDIFRNIVFLDLSFNHLTSVRYVTSFMLDKLIFLSLRGNPLKEIILNTANHHSILSLFDLRSIYHYLYLRIVLSSDLHNQVLVVVSELQMCCILPTNIECTSDDNRPTKMCMSLFSNSLSKYYFYSLSMLSLSLSIAVMVRYILVDFRSKKVFNNKKKHYLLILLNYSAATVLISLYLSSLVIVDTTQVNVLVWVFSPACFFLQLLLYASVQCVMIFKAFSIALVSLQIIYPFKHQCVFLKWTGLVTLVVWLIILSTYSLVFLEQQQHDLLCSVGKCSKIDSLNLLLCLICAIDIFAIMSCFVTASKTCVNLNQHLKDLDKHQFQMKRNRLKMCIYATFKHTLPILSELPFRLCLLILLASSFAIITFEEFCISVFVYALPTNTLCSSLIFLLHK